MYLAHQWGNFYFPHSGASLGAGCPPFLSFYLLVALTKYLLPTQTRCQIRAFEIAGGNGIQYSQSRAVKQKREQHSEAQTLRRPPESDIRENYQRTASNPDQQLILHTILPPTLASSERGQRCLCPRGRKMPVFDPSCRLGGFSHGAAPPSRRGSRGACAVRASSSASA